MNVQELVDFLLANFDPGDKVQRNNRWIRHSDISVGPLGVAVIS